MRWFTVCVAIGMIAFGSTSSFAQESSALMLPGGVPGGSDWLAEFDLVAVDAIGFEPDFLGFSLPEPTPAPSDIVVELFAGLDGSKQPQDFGVNAHFGGRIHTNVGFKLLDEYGLGIQAGVARNITDHAVAVTSRVDGAGSRRQFFSTVGLFQRTDVVQAGLVWDYVSQEDYDEFDLHQLRGLFGVQVTERDMIGVSGMVPLSDDAGTWGPIPVRLSPIGQGSIFWRHTWESAVEVTSWVGIAEGHGEVNVALGDAPAVDERLVFGADLHIPLSDRWAIYGEANFITPADTGTVDSYLGVVYYFGGNSYRGRRESARPVLPVANNTSFSVNLSR